MIKNSSLMFGALICASGLAWLVWQATGRSSHAEAEQTPKQTAVAARNSDQAGQGSPGSAISAGPSAAYQPVASASGPAAQGDWTSGFSGEQPYVQALRLREAREAGSFAAALAITQACRRAYGQANAGRLVAPDRDPMIGADKQPNHALRLQALDTINRRCEPFFQHHDIDQPLADDVHGLALQRAIGQVPDYFDPLKARQHAQLLAQQGHLHLFMPVRPYWNGEAIRESQSRHRFYAAFSLAQELATSPSHAPEQDIRLLEACTRGRCAKDFVELWRIGNSRDAETRKQVEALAQEMAAALRAGDYQKFLP